MFTSLYTFVSYFEHTNFMYDNPADVDFYGSFYVGMLGAGAILLGAAILFFDEDVTRPVLKKHAYPPITKAKEKVKPISGIKSRSSFLPYSRLGTYPKPVNE